MVFFKEQSSSLDVDVGVIVGIGCFAVSGEVREVDAEGGVKVALEEVFGVSEVYIVV